MENCIECGSPVYNDYCVRNRHRNVYNPEKEIQPRGTTKWKELFNQRLPLIIEEVKRMERGETEISALPSEKRKTTVWRCVTCRSFFDSIGKEDYKFCPHCGLKINWK